MSTNDVNVFLLEDKDTEVVACDACLRLWEQTSASDDGHLLLYVLTLEFERKVAAATQVSAEGLMHMCKGHQHWVCKHLHKKMVATVAAAELRRTGAEQRPSKPGRHGQRHHGRVTAKGARRAPTIIDGGTLPQELSELIAGLPMTRVRCPLCGEESLYYSAETSDAELAALGYELPCPECEVAS